MNELEWMSHQRPEPEWLLACAQHAEELLGIGDLMAADDPYDALDFLKDAYAVGSTPQKAVEELFADDLASMAHDELMRAEAEAE